MAMFSFTFVLGAVCGFLCGLWRRFRAVGNPTPPLPSNVALLSDYRARRVS